MFDDFIAQKCLQYEEGRLEEKYPDFKALMREYREGILLLKPLKMWFGIEHLKIRPDLKLFMKK